MIGQMAQRVRDSSSKRPAEQRATESRAPAAQVPEKKSRSLLDSALYNLNIAQQYIDESYYLAEHRLISFHYGIALLALHRNDRNKRAQARQCLMDAANWQLDPSDKAEMGDAHLQLVSEARYNLGVIAELSCDFKGAQLHYANAILNAKERTKVTGRDLTQSGVVLLSRFGWISAAVAQLTEEASTSNGAGSDRSSTETLMFQARISKKIAKLRGLLRSAPCDIPMARPSEMLRDRKVVSAEESKTSVGSSSGEVPQAAAPVVAGSEETKVQMIRRYARKGLDILMPDAAIEARPVARSEAFEGGQRTVVERPEIEALTIKRIQNELDKMEAELKALSSPQQQRS